MNRLRFKPTSSQLPMPGIPTPEGQHPATSCCNVAPGQEVLYLGRISGGPHYRSRGVVKQALQRKAVVDMGRLGTWHIPYYFLSVPKAA
ncbi:MAG: hypothetical protein IIC22_06405 [Chloroflexi bacterium]|nr:hypothetical protein [Chloroflexota bacterium]